MINGISQFLKNRAISQYLGIAAQGAAILKGETVVAMEDGIYFLDSPDSDEGFQIHAWIKSIKTDFGTHARKRMRSLYFRGKAKELEISLGTEDTILDLEYSSTSGELRQKEGYVQGQHSQFGTYWQIGVGNKNGDDFSIDAIDALLVTRPMATGRRPE